MKDIRFNDIYDAIEDEMFMKHWLEDNENLDRLKYEFDEDLYCDECNIWENEKYEMLNGGN
ncbi:hypothetical protein [Paraclostridium bifermentans]|uniref:hypothetical protein n=1 Tax=Paraclostridium bifermentans TaxID=1490 RepID=UPI0022E84015|nr:hypothetical protein [Paraclostridium bifermentans]